VAAAWTRDKRGSDYSPARRALLDEWRSSRQLCRKSELGHDTCALPHLQT
jgi:hypothetical protein